MDPHIAANRATWDERVPIHLRNSTGFYGIDKFRAGGCTLHAIELGELGPVAGKRLLHLQCHFGLDTLSWARRGAAVTGVDCSDPAIAAARALAADTGIEAEFVVANVCDVRAAVAGEFDIVFASWGALAWLPDIGRWARAAASCLAPGGVLYAVDAHSALLQHEEDGGKLVLRYDWRTPPDRPLRFEEKVTYTGDTTPLAASTTYAWHHPPAAVAQAMVDAGLRLELLREHEELVWPAFPLMTKTPAGTWRLPDGHPRLPLAFSAKARKA